LASFHNIISRTVFGDVSFSEDDDEDPDAPTAASLMRQQLVARQEAVESSPDDE